MRRSTDNPQIVPVIHGSGALGLSDLALELSRLCRVCAFTFGDERGSREREFKCGGERMAGGDSGQFDLRALQRVGDFTNERAEWKR